MTEVICPGCGGRVQTADTSAGQSQTCPACGQVFVLQGPVQPPQGRVTVRQVLSDGLIADGPYDQLVGATANAVSMSGFTVSLVDPASGVIRAARGLNWLTWGENIAITFRGMPDGATRVFIQSTLVFGFDLWGRNSSNVQKIIAALVSLVR